MICIIVCFVKTRQRFFVKPLEKGCRAYFSIYNLIRIISMEFNVNERI
jgi:hypothetical protein